MNLRQYTLDSIFNLPKHRGRTVREVAKIDPSYVYWCIRDVDSFYVSEETFLAIKDINRPFRLTVAKREETRRALDEKKKRWEDQEKEYNSVSGIDEYDLERGHNFDDKPEPPEVNWYDGMSEEEANDAYSNID